ncbi:hypothetical protein RintRC_1643 [Richelia intracellularis]|nr:hypothetical protein RintRC_1643 [Richelia intracellularis]
MLYLLNKILNPNKNLSTSEGIFIAPQFFSAHITDLMVKFILFN